MKQAMDLAVGAVLFVALHLARILGVIFFFATLGLAFGALAGATVWAYRLIA